MAQKQKRRALIKGLVQNQAIGSQDELVGLLHDQGVDCTQATLSRDLRDMGIVRRNTRSGPAYRLDKGRIYRDAVREVVAMEILSVRHNTALVVVRTLEGRANGVAAFIDAWADHEILGTVAGDDTVFIAPSNPQNISELVDRIRGLTAASTED